MALLKAVALGAVAAISVPYVLGDAEGVVGRAAYYGAIHPVPGEFSLFFSIPIFLVVAAFGWGLLKASER